MVETGPDHTLTALLASQEGDAPTELGTVANEPRAAAPPTLERRIEFYLNAVYGRNAIVTAEMRNAARDHLLAAMAADLAEQTGAAPGEANASLMPGTMKVSPTSISAQSPIWARIETAWRRLTSAVAEAFTVRNMRMAAVPLVLLLVVGSVWTRDLLHERGIGSGSTSIDPISGSANDEGPTRSLIPLSRPTDRAREEDLRRTLAAEEAARGPDDPAVARLLVQLGALYRDEGRYEIAERLYKRALAIQRIALGRKDAETLRTLKDLVAIYRGEGRSKEADDLLSQAAQ